MKDLDFDEMLDFAATATPILSGTELVKTYRSFFIKCDEINERKKIASFLHTLLKDLNFYQKYPETKWTEKNIFNYLQKFEI